MGTAGPGGQPSLAFPFVEQHKPSLDRLKRSHQIAEEVEEYLRVVAQTIAPYIGIVGLAPEAIDYSSLPERPEVLDHLEKTEQWGFPNSGTWLDQPLEWLEDIEAAKAGRSRYQSRVEAEQRGKDVFKSAPPPEMFGVA